jgi:hypothetical protein
MSSFNKVQLSSHTMHIHAHAWIVELTWFS